MSGKRKQQDNTKNYAEITDNILNNLSIAIYVTDLATNEILYANTALQKMYCDSPPTGKICWEALKNQNKRCEFCPIPNLLKNPGKDYQWKLSKDKRHFQVYDSIIPWSDGRMVHLQYMVDVTE